MVATSSASPGWSYPASPLGCACVCMRAHTCTHMSLSLVLICSLGKGVLYGFGDSVSWVLVLGFWCSSLNRPGHHRHVCWWLWGTAALA